MVGQGGLSSCWVQAGVLGTWERNGIMPRSTFHMLGFGRGRVADESGESDTTCCACAIGSDTPAITAHQGR